MSEEKQPEVKTKQSFREEVWIQMAKEELTISFRSLHNKVPYFKGTAEATERLSQLDQFKDAKLLMISPDKPQESVVVLSLQNKKEVLIPRRRLFGGLFLHMKNAAGLSEEEAQNAVTKHNMKQIEHPVGFDTTDLKIDMLILGSVCVNRAGYRIGDGEGFADLEYGILAKMKAVNENTVIVTTVHDCQVLDIPNDLFEAHDVPVDIIITPTQTITANCKLAKPAKIFWSLLSKRKLATMPVLNEIKESEEKSGKEVNLKEVDSDVESYMQEKVRIKKMINKLNPKLKQKKFVSDVVLKESERNKDLRRKSFLRKRKLQKLKDNSENINDSSNKPTDNQSTAKPKTPHCQRVNLTRNHIDFSLRLSNIASTVRVRDLKKELLARGVKPSNITWRGQRGFCYLHFAKLQKKNSSQDQPIQVDSIVANLQQLKIGEAPLTSETAFITVEPAKPITRIEVTDVSTV